MGSKGNNGKRTETERGPNDTLASQIPSSSSYETAEEVCFVQSIYLTPNHIKIVFIDVADTNLFRALFQIAISFQMALYQPPMLQVRKRVTL